jgi:hypothetical protein
VLVVLGSGVMPVMAGSGQKVDVESFAERDRSSNPNKIELIIIDQIFETTPYGFFIAAGATEEGRKATFFYIDESSFSKKEKKELKDFMRSIWKKYDVRIEHKGGEVLITTDSKELNLSKEEEAMFEKFAKAVDEFWQKNGVESKWLISQHQDIIRVATQKWYLNETLVNIAADHADDPDYFDGIFVPWYHYYENYVYFNWESGFRFKDVITSVSLSQRYRESPDIVVKQLLHQRC